jgi:DNA polymerase III epsilon subunit-like protein
MILFFDTETTGLPKNWKAPVTDLDNWPRLVQLAYLVYDFDGNLIHSCNEIVKPNGFTIPVDASNVHGITTDLANQRGIKIQDVFELFYFHIKRAKVIVAHNMAYDEKILGSELIRLGLDNILDTKEKICTMESSVDLCKINGPYGYKWPRLDELHRYLFQYDFTGAHDALADIQATAKCFWELKTRKVIKLKHESDEPLTNISKKKIVLKFKDEIDENGNKIKITYFNAILEELNPFIYSNNLVEFNKSDYQLAKITFTDLNGNTFSRGNVHIFIDDLFYNLELGNTYSFKITRAFDKFGFPKTTFTQLHTKNEVILAFAINNKKSLRVTYLNSKNEISNRILKNVDYSLNVLTDDDIIKYGIGKTHFTGFCIMDPVSWPAICQN